jgi:hypothetical protein
LLAVDLRPASISSSEFCFMLFWPDLVVTAFPVVFYKEIWGALDKKTFPAASLKSVFCPARPDTVSGAPTPSPPDAPGTSDTTRSEARRGVAGPMR